MKILKLIIINSEIRIVISRKEKAQKISETRNLIVGRLKINL